MNGNKITDTAFFKMLIELNDEQAIATAIVTELLDSIETSFLIMSHYGYTSEQLITPDAVYDVAKQIMKLKK
jgi:hypothetical protein